MNSRALDEHRGRRPVMLALCVLCLASCCQEINDERAATLARLDALTSELYSKEQDFRRGNRETIDRCKEIQSQVFLLISVSPGPGVAAVIESILRTPDYRQTEIHLLLALGQHMDSPRSSKLDAEKPFRWNRKLLSSLASKGAACLRKRISVEDAGAYYACLMIEVLELFRMDLELDAPGRPEYPQVDEPAYAKMIAYLEWQQRAFNLHEK